MVHNGLGIIKSRLGQVLKTVGLTLDLTKEEKIKIFWLTFSFFCVIGAYTVLKELKDILFSEIVGSTSLYKVKMLSMFVLLPATLLYAKLVDYMSRFSLLVFYSMVYGLGGIVIAYFLADPVIGLPNNTPDASRIFGWVIYLFYEGVVPFVVSVFWAFANSVTAPETAKKGYTLMIAGSKLGGMLMAGLGWLMFMPSSILGRLGWSSVTMIQILLVGSSLLLAISPLIIYVLLRKASKDSMDGYKAVHQYEQEQEAKGESETGVLSGLVMMMKHPYILGIFGMMFFYELVNVVLGIQRTVLLQAGAKDSVEFVGEMFRQRFFMHFVGLIISFFGTRILVKRLGERVCLALIPLITGALLIYFMLAYNQSAIMFVFMALGMINYAFASPLRESLYIPTVKDIRFKSKAWIESFGQRFAKACGSSAIGFIQSFAAVGTAAYFTLFAGFFSITIALWTLVALALGKKYASVIKNGEIIGAE